MIYVLYIIYVIILYIEHFFCLKYHSLCNNIVAFFLFTKRQSLYYFGAMIKAERGQTSYMYGSQVTKELS